MRMVAGVAAVRSSPPTRPLIWRSHRRRARCGRPSAVIVTDLERRIGTHLFGRHARVADQRCRARFVWLIGADNLAQLPRWRRWRRLVRTVPIAVFDREPYSYVALAGRMASAMPGSASLNDAPVLAECPPPAWVYLRLRRHHASSTALRQKSTASGRWARRKEDGP